MRSVSEGARRISPVWGGETGTSCGASVAKAGYGSASINNPPVKNARRKAGTGPCVPEAARSGKGKITLENDFPSTRDHGLSEHYRLGRNIASMIWIHAVAMTSQRDTASSAGTVLVVRG